MLRLENIKKSYKTGATVTEALKGISLGFGKGEFVAILGASGCGKTTLLNVIGGLDRYDSGSLVINGTPTERFTAQDWDSYRNHSVGFVFQAYNLIPHQTVIENVELALTLSGVSRAERRERALAALKKVGIADQAKKKPNQLSGGQMQRVAIARALVNDPEILLADEPTGALDSKTSVQIMEILKEISQTKLVIMVTHNPELAEKYATRIVSLHDGLVVSDTAPNPAVPAAPQSETPKKKKAKRKKGTSMSFLTALSLSLGNLLTKKARTFLTSFAGSIGIIGIALILSLSSGFKAYINKVQEDTLSTYPISITRESVDMTELMEEFMNRADEDSDHGTDKIYARPIYGKTVNAMISGTRINDLAAFKEYIDTNRALLDGCVSDIKYGYGINPYIYLSDTSGGVIRTNPMNIMEKMYGMQDSSGMSAGMGMGGSTDIWRELIDNRELLESQYDSIGGGRWPEGYDEAVLFVNDRNEINDFMLCALGFADQNEMIRKLSDAMFGGRVDESLKELDYSEIIGRSFTVITAAERFTYDEESGVWKDRSDDAAYMKSAIASGGVKVKIVGIMRPKESAAATSGTGMIGYTHALTEHIISLNNASDIAKAQQSTETDTAATRKYGKTYRRDEVDVFTGIPFGYTPKEAEPLTMEVIRAYIETLPADQQAQLNAWIANASEEEVIGKFTQMLGSDKTTDATLAGNKAIIGTCELDTPTSIDIYAKDFESKEKINAFIADYNSSHGEEKSISYTDYVGVMMDSVSTIIDVISYVLIAFVSISLVVSSIMIGVITYISVLERTKEIGILRAIGASKGDISRVFNAETLIVGFISGMFGILATLLLNIPVNLIIKNLGNIENVSKLPLAGAVALVAISMLLTFVAGLIPSRIAAKKDPVVALRSE